MRGQGRAFAPRPRRDVGVGIPFGLEIPSITHMVAGRRRLPKRPAGGQHPRHAAIHLPGDTAGPFYFTGDPAGHARSDRSPGRAAHNNMQPYLTLNFCIALQGIFPQRP